jgi:type I restriction-modification system DNA methylase subunit
MIDKSTAWNRINELVNRFGEQYDSYMLAGYNETMTRRDFIDPFFKSLGWDIDNEEGYAEAYREVIHEDKLNIGGATKAPDYSFRLVGGKRLFFVEAKKPSVYIKEDIHPSYQVRRYGWSAKHPISIITDFEEFAVYDCTQKPNPNDKPSVARIKYLTFHDYQKEFDFIWETFSKEHVLKGSFDKFIQSDTHKKGTASVDKEFLESLDKWRTYLAVNISWNNKNLTEDEINFAVQQTIDRIIFLRIAEDRHIEPYGSLKHTLNHGDFYTNLFDVFHKADDKYNSGLFDLKKDRISKSLIIENKVLKTIINELYYPECPYEFSVLPVEILGSVYEQFLGKIIRITPAHHAKIEEKPEVKKAGGVYYTPQYIVDYIIKNTVGKLIEGKTPAEISPLKVVDPACGSGSFLIGAFQYLLDYHKNYYSNSGKPSKGNKDNPLTPEGQLSTAEKKRILLNNIYGVDIDYNAVEVTKLSLLLKCMEGETEASINQQFKLFNERILPTLDDNIKSGNSLISTDYYDNQLDFGEEKKIKPFNWKNSFPDVFKQGGFDVVVGNPPYVRQELISSQKNYFKGHYQVFHGMADLYSYFIERSMKLLNSNGLYGVIVANKWMRANYGEPLRKFLKAHTLFEIIDFGDLPVFETATTYPCILIAGNPGKDIGPIKLTLAKTLKFNSLTEYVDQNNGQLNKDSLSDAGWSLAGEIEQGLIRKISQVGKPLGEYVDRKIYRGVLTGLNEAFVIDSETKERLVAYDERSIEIIKPFLTGKEIKRYQPLPNKHYLILFPKGFTREKGQNPKDAWKWIKENYPAIAGHLEPFESNAKKRYDKGEYWWELRACDYYTEFEKPKIISPAIANLASFTFDVESSYSNDKTSIIPINDLYLLGLLNSSLMDYFIKSIASTKQGGYYEYKPMYLSKIPVKILDETIDIEVHQHSTIELLVKQILSLNSEIRSCKLSDKIEQIKAHIQHHENKINEIVYQIYELTEEEIAIIERNKNKSLS